MAQAIEYEPFLRLRLKPLAIVPGMVLYRLADYRQPIVMLMVMAWVLAGVLGALMNASGFIEALIWIAAVGSMTARHDLAIRDVERLAARIDRLRSVD